MITGKRNRKRRADYLSGPCRVGATNTQTLYYTELPRQAGPFRRQRFAYGVRQVIRYTCHVVHADELAVRGDDIR